MVPIPPNGPSPPLSLSLSTLSLSPFATFNSTDPFSQTDRPFSLSLSLSRFSVPLYGGFMQSSDNEEYQVSSSPPDLHHRESWRILVSSRERSKETRRNRGGGIHSSRGITLGVIYIYIRSRIVSGLSFLRFEGSRSIGFIPLRVVGRTRFSMGFGWKIATMRRVREREGRGD